MLLWLCFALLAGGAILALLWPIIRSSERASRADSADVAVYNDQLNSIAVDRDRGLLNADEAEAARTELARRLLRAAESRQPGRGSGIAPPPGHGGHGRWVARVAMVVTALVPIGALVTYLAIGAPGLSGQPHAERTQQSAGDRSLEDLIGMVEARLRQFPDDAQGWEVIAPVYARSGKYREAANAYTNAIRLLGETPKRLLGLGEALILAENGLVGTDARRILQRLLALEPGRSEGVFWLAMAKEQDGDVPGAIADLKSLLASSPGDAPWRSLIETRISELQTRATDVAAGAPAVTEHPAQGVAAAPAAPSVAGPSAEDVAAASEMSANERRLMIERMVQGLADRLDKNGQDVEGWKKLVKAYKVLGREDEARAAMTRARQTLANDAAALRALDELGESLGMGS